MDKCRLSGQNDCKKASYHVKYEYKCQLAYEGIVRFVEEMMYG